MTPRELSDIHKAAFTRSRPWNEEEFETLLANPHVHVVEHPNGFALLQLVAREAELLTIAVRPECQGKGIGHQLMRRWMVLLDPDEAFLEVASDNLAAQHLYKAHGFAEVARRQGYYTRENSESADAIVMRVALRQR